MTDTKKRSLTSCDPVELSTKSLYQVDHSVIDEAASPTSPVHSVPHSASYTGGWRGRWRHRWGGQWRGDTLPEKL